MSMSPDEQDFGKQRRDESLPGQRNSLPTGLAIAIRQAKEISTPSD